jgi:hypothetical protein
MGLPAQSSSGLDASALPADPMTYRKHRSGLKWWLIGLAVALWTIAWVSGTLYFIGPGKDAGRAESGPPISLPFVTHAPESAAPAPPPQPLEPAPAEPAASADAALGERLAKLEAQQRRYTQAAASALAAASLAEAAQSAAPFDTELASIGSLLPANADLAGLQRLSRQGAPTRAALAAEFTETVTRAASAAREPQPGAGVLARLSSALSRIVTIRRVNDVTGFGADAILARAQRELDDGDLEAAVADLDKLPPPARKALAAWRERAQRRLDIDQQVAGIRTAAMRALSASAGGRP